MVVAEIRTCPILKFLPEKAFDALFKIVENNNNRVYLLEGFFKEFLKLNVENFNIFEQETGGMKIINFQAVEKVNKVNFLTDLMIVKNEQEQTISILKRKMPLMFNLNLPKTESAEFVFDFNNNMCFLKDDKHGLTSKFVINKKVQENEGENEK